MGDLYTQTLRASVPDAPGYLELNAGANIRLVEWNPPLPQFKRETVDGPYQKGRRLISATEATATLSGAVRIYGTDWADQQAWVAAFVAALTQFAYTLTEVLDGVTRVWECEPADLTLGDGGLDAFGVNRARQVYVFQIPCSEVAP